MGKKRQKYLFSDDLGLELKKFSLVAVDIVGDGNCLFRSISDQIYGSQGSHAEIRQEICNHIEKRKEIYADFMTDSNHVQIMRKDGIYGGNLELVAASRLYKRNIHVYQAGIGFWNVEIEGNVGDPIHIAYHHEYEHYSSVRNADGPFTGLPMVKVILSSKPGNQTEIDAAKTVKFNRLIDIVKKSIDLSEAENLVIKELLEKFGRNPSAVVDYIFEERAKCEAEIEASHEDPKELEAKPQFAVDKSFEESLPKTEPNRSEIKDLSKSTSRTGTKLKPKDRKAARNAKIAITREKRKNKRATDSKKGDELISSKPDSSLSSLTESMKSISI